MKKASVLLIITGGTISMGRKANNSLAPLSCNQVLASIPEIQDMNVNISSVAFSPLIDSSDISLDNWVSICEIIEQHYASYDGFVVLHGTDTMSFSASVVSFMLENLSKPVIFTGSQLPVGVHRSDAKENLITSIEIAAAKNEKGSSVVQEVCVFFEDQLMRGNRTTKRNAEEFDAFRSIITIWQKAVYISNFIPNTFGKTGRRKPSKCTKRSITTSQYYVFSQVSINIPSRQSYVPSG